MRRFASISLFAVACAACAAPKSAPPVTPAEAAPAAPAEAPAEAPAAPAEAPAAAAGPDDIATPPDVAAPPATAERTASGLASRVLRPGTGTVKPKPQDEVKVHYSGWTADGKLFDSSIPRGAPLTFPLRGVILGWTEGVQLMVVGEKRRLWIPKELAYGDQPGMPAGMLVFDVELLDIIQGPEPLPAPADVAAAPADAKRDRSGLAWKVTQKGTGKKHPAPTDHVRFQYTAWSTGGTMLATSRQGQGPAETDLPGRIGAWKAMLPQMVAGERRLVWAPAAQALEHLPGVKPDDTVVFELELLSFMKPPATPKDLAQPPRDAETSASGLVSKVLKKGKGKDHPTAESTVVVQVTGWTADGEIFDTTVYRGEPQKLKLAESQAGWSEGARLMVVGEQRRFWVPEALAKQKGGEYGPPGQLVYDVELVAIDPPAATP
jgi:peptidylprolyl isomerase